MYVCMYVCIRECMLCVNSGAQTKRPAGVEAERHSATNNAATTPAILRCGFVRITFSIYIHTYSTYIHTYIHTYSTYIHTYIHTVSTESIHDITVPIIRKLRGVAFLVGAAVVARYLRRLQLGDPVTDKTAVTPYTFTEIFRRLPTGKIMVT